MFTEALGREVTIDDLIEKQGEERVDLEAKDDELLQAIERLGDRMDKRFAEVNRQIADLRDSSSK